jgi:hypothetical protein
MSEMKRDFPMEQGRQLAAAAPGDDPQLDSVGKHTDTERSSPPPFQKRQPGRPKTLTDEERGKHQRDYQQNYRRKHKLTTKNISVDAELVDGLNRAADRLEAKFGFRPTLSQTLHHLLKQIKTDES